MYGQDTGDGKRDQHFFYAGLKGSLHPWRNGHSQVINSNVPTTEIKIMVFTCPFDLHAFEVMLHFLIEIITLYRNALEGKYFFAYRSQL